MIKNRNLFGDIPLKIAMVAWNPVRYETMWKPGKVVIIPWPDEQGWCNRLQVSYTTGACWTAWGQWSKKERMLKLMVEAWHMVCRDDVPPQNIHEAFMVIPEYRESLSLENFFESNS